MGHSVSTVGDDVTRQVSRPAQWGALVASYVTIRMGHSVSAVDDVTRHVLLSGKRLLMWLRHV